MKYYFVRSGDINYRYGSARIIGVFDYHWATTSSSLHYDGATRPTGYGFHFNKSEIATSVGPDDRWHAFPIRCLAY